MPLSKVTKTLIVSWSWILPFLAFLIIRLNFTPLEAFLIGCATGSFGYLITVKLI